MNAPNFRLDGRVALITGAGRGIGLGMAQAFCAVGANVAMQDIDLDVVTTEAEKITAQGAGRAIALGGDVADPTLPTKCVDATISKLGGLHIFVNNAAIQFVKHWLELTVEEIHREFNCDLVAPLLFCQAVVPHMKRQKWGRIINMGSVQGRGGNPRMFPYSISKGAMINMTIGLAKDLAEHNITVNLIAPGWFNTYRNREDFKTEEDVAEKGKRVPLGRVGNISDCAGTAILLCSPAGEYITGQSITIDGGLTGGIVSGR